jgi:hypothetical protein
MHIKIQKHIHVTNINPHNISNSGKNIISAFSSLSKRSSQSTLYSNSLGLIAQRAMNAVVRLTKPYRRHPVSHDRSDHSGVIMGLMPIPIGHTENRQDKTPAAKNSP